MGTSFLVRHRDAVLLIFLIAYPLTVWAALRAFGTGENDPEDWLPESFEETRNLRWFQQNFVADDVLVVSWDGFALEDLRAAKLAALLRSPVDVGGGERAVLTRRVLIPREVIAELCAEPLSLSHHAAVRRLNGWLASADGSTGCVLVLVSAEGWQHRAALVHTIQRWAKLEQDLAPEDVHLAGVTLDSLAIDLASKRYLPAMMIASYALSLVIMTVLFGSLALTVLVFIDSLFCQQLSLATVVLTGATMDSVMLIVPSLVYVLAVSTSVHMLNYYRDSVEELPFDEAPLQALRQAFVPCLLSTLTTGIGLLSLTTSSLVPVDKFGLYGTRGILLSTATLFVLLPCQLSWLGPRLKFLVSESQLSVAPALGWIRVRRGIERLRAPILLTTLCVFGVSGWGVAQLQSSARVHDLLGPNSKLIQDYGWYEKKIGPLVPLEIVLQIPTSTSTEPGPSVLDRLRLVKAIHQLVEQQPEVGAVISSVTFAPSVERRSRRMFDVAREALINGKLEQHWDEIASTGFYRQTQSAELWRISARSYAGQLVDYNAVLNELSEAIAPLLAQAQEFGFPKINAVYCGGIPLVEKTQRQMLVDLRAGFTSAAGLISLVMVALSLLYLWPTGRQTASVGNRSRVVLKSMLAGAVSMVSNLLPCAVAFGTMGLIGVRVDIGTMLTASVALGIAVDDTLHFLTWFRAGLSSGNTCRESVDLAFRQCGLAMIETSLICGLGLLVYACSPFVPIARFAWLMFFMLALALFGDLVVLPALLLGRGGDFFHK